MRWISLLGLCVIHIIYGLGDVELLGAYFQFSNEVAKSIFSGSIPCIQLEYSRDFNQYLRVWLNTDYCMKEGNSINIGDNSTLQMVSFSIGPKFFYENEDGMAPYVGFGLIGSWIHTTDGSIYLPANTNKGSAGIVGKFGVRYSFFERLVLDFFFDASFQPVATEYGDAIAKKNINLGGYKAGLGIQTFF